uniref:Uncharacterized protein n=1 Tax=Anguilla anguilla TaxID=7936 RepID=A0A0E9QM93_ANGAN
MLHDVSMSDAADILPCSFFFPKILYFGTQNPY